MTSGTVAEVAARIMNRYDHVPSYYSATAVGVPQCTTLSGATKADVCIVGAGFTGVSAALNLAERGYSVVVLEAARIGWGASGRNGGQICSGYSPSMAKIAGWVGIEEAKRLWDVAEEAKAIIRDRVRRHDIHCDLKPGYLLGAAKPADISELQAELDLLRKRHDYRQARMVEREELRTMVAADCYHGGMYDEGGGHLHPLNYNLGLARAAIEAGARIYERSPVIRLELGTAPQAYTASGAVTARYLLLCGNAYLGNLVPQIRKKIMPVGTYVATTKVLGEERARSLIPCDAAVSDTKFVLDYYRRTGDHRLLFGGRVSYTTLAPRNLNAAMRRSMLAVFPGLSDVEFDYVWGGNVAITVERTPHLGRIGGNVYFAHGFSGVGVALTGIAGKVMAEAIAGTAERFDMFTRLPHTTFHGGRLFRTPMLAMAMLWYRLRDLL